jgi:predicted nucleic acid-binding protein
VERLTEKLSGKGLKTFDAAHIASAVESGCDYFITTDDGVLNCNEKRVTIISPGDFLKAWEDYKNDE